MLKSHWEWERTGVVQLVGGGQSDQGSCSPYQATSEWVGSPLEVGLRHTQKSSGRAHVQRVCGLLKALKRTLVVHFLWSGTGKQCSREGNSPCVHPRSAWRSENARRLPTHGQKRRWASLGFLRLCTQLRDCKHLSADSNGVCFFFWMFRKMAVYLSSY